MNAARQPERTIDQIETELMDASRMLASYYRDEIVWQQDHVDTLKVAIPALRLELRTAIDRRDHETRMWREQGRAK